ncbi:hypothetical protein DM02DRAFT_43809 [Periconia macrospinosa]|uniref:Uncharacterized protein n=1 Tax=Periconia macrospinosa TaxID=97972 RepID=A0A2V1CX58_9PLEO|nr:hypothetical protein DM02DRAFT_43809 [Periconia macrospinosa]
MAIDMTASQDAQSYLSSWLPILHQYLTIEEESQIIEQFRLSWRPNAQVLWSGILREEAQEWADKHGMQTLTTVMGPLMDKKNPMSPNRKRSGPDWTKSSMGLLQCLHGQYQRVKQSQCCHHLLPKGSTQTGLQASK